MARHSFTFSDNGKKLTNLLLKAAGMEDKRVQALTCHCARGSVITFDVTFQADDEKIGDALGEVDVTHLTDEFVRKEVEA